MGFALAGLIHDFAIEIQAQPFHAFQQGIYGLAGGAFKVGILDEQQKFAGAMTGKKPVEDCSTDIADMHMAGWGRSEAH